MRLNILHIPYGGKVLREKTFANFKVVKSAIRENFLCKIGNVASVDGTSEQSVQVFSAKHFPPICESFSPSKVFCDTVI